MSEEKNRESGEINISQSLLGKLIIVFSLLGGVGTFLLLQSVYTGLLVFTSMLLIWSAHYTYMNKKNMSEMCCMMSGMVFGMVAGFFVGVFAGLITSDFLAGMIIGTAAGVIFGIPLGRLGGPLGRMEGVMSGPMGGIMGAMTGVMVRFYNVHLFVPFFMLIIILTLWEQIRVVHSYSRNITRSFIYIGIILSVLAFGTAMMSNYSLSATGLAAGNFGNNNIGSSNGQVQTQAQELTITATATGYSPNNLVVKKDVLVRLTLKADSDAGCTRSIVFPDFNIQKTIPQSGSTTAEFTPTKAGTFGFSCSMNMAHGTIVVQ